jgi:hypothetical protein
MAIGGCTVIELVLFFRLLETNGCKKLLNGKLHNNYEKSWQDYII